MPLKSTHTLKGTMVCFVALRPYVVAAYVKIRLTPKALRAAHLSTFERHVIIMR
jgi:hypothetical protein